MCHIIFEVNSFTFHLWLLPSKAITYLLWMCMVQIPLRDDCICHGDIMAILHYTHTHCCANQLQHQCLSYQTDLIKVRNRTSIFVANKVIAHLQAAKASASA